MTRLIMEFAGDSAHTALVVDGILTELLIDDASEPTAAGNIYVGLVRNVLPSGLAFVDVGLKQNAFIDLNDNREKTGLKQGQSVVLQILKDGAGGKGPSATTEISFAGANVIIYTSSEQTIGVSKKIGDRAERLRLKEVAKGLVQDGYGIVMRTTAAGQTEEALRAEAEKLIEISRKTLGYSQYIKAPAALHAHGHYLSGTVWQLRSTGFTEIITNNSGTASELRVLLAEAGIDAEITVKDTPCLFAEYGIDSQRDKALQRKIWLSCGGFLFIEKTEACVVIDVNTGKYLGVKNAEKSIFKTNCEAAVEIARQIRLRNLSGMIIVDFIDLHSTENKKQLQRLFMAELSRDRIPVNLVGMTELGLMQLTRKRVRAPISEQLTTACACCGGTGQVKKGISHG